MESESVVRNAVAQPIIRVVARNGDAFVHLDSSLGPAIHYKVKGASMAEFFTNWIRFVRDKSIKLANIGIYWTANAEAALEYLLRIAHALHWKTRNRIVKEMFGEGIGVWLFAAKVMERLGGNHSIFTEDYANRWIQRLLGDKANTDITTIQNWWIIGVIFQYKCLRVIPVKDRISMILQNDCTRRRFQDWVDPQGRPLSRPRETAVYDSMIREYLDINYRVNINKRLCFLKAIAVVIDVNYDLENGFDPSMKRYRVTNFLKAVCDQCQPVSSNALAHRLDRVRL